MNIYNIASGYNFLQSLHDFIREKSPSDFELSKIMIFLPSRRSCNELRRIFLESSVDEAIILPTIKAIGDIDYDDFIYDDLEYITENTSRIKYRIMLIKELLEWSKTLCGEVFGGINIQQASDLSLELDNFLSEVEKQNLNLNDLDKIVDDEYSRHWQEILKFLKVFGKKWNEFMEKNSIASPNFKAKMIGRVGEFFKNHKPDSPIFIAGISGSVKSTNDFITTTLKHDNCYFIFKGLDKIMDDIAWKKIEFNSPQYYFKCLLNDYLKIDRFSVKEICYKNNLVVNCELERVLSYAMLPAVETYKWQDKISIDKGFLNSISKVECKNEFEEIDTVYNIIKNQIETKKGNISIVVSDKDFALRLELYLRSNELDVNNAFGNKISRTATIRFMFLILDAYKSNFESIAFLSLLKDKFTLFGYERKDLDKFILEFEDNVLRGNNSLLFDDYLKYSNEDLTTFLTKIKSCFSQFDNLKNKNFTEILNIHISIAKKIASNNDIDGENILWKNEKYGSELTALFDEILAEADSFGEVENLDDYSSLLVYLIAENSYSDKYSLYPSISIISPSEGRLINYDLVIIPRLNEGQFPTHTSSDPWMSKSMRHSFGLNAKEEIIGANCYDFVQYLNSKEVILLRSQKENGVPTTKSKFLLKLETFLKCQNLSLKNDTTWNNIFSKISYVEQMKSVERPKPTPPLVERPRELSATKIEKLKNNPYDIYAEKILKLKKKDDFNENKIFSAFGNAVHNSLDEYTKRYKSLNKLNLVEELIKIGEIKFKVEFKNKNSRKLFFNRFKKIAQWFVHEDEKIRAEGYEIISEENLELYLKDLDFKLTARCDRLEKNGNTTNICDYKTGVIPSKKDVELGKKPQLVVEAVIISDKNNVGGLYYWSLKSKDSKIENVFTNSIIDIGKEGIKKLIAYFNVFENGYIATGYNLNEGVTYSDYKHLSRVEEWGYATN